MGTDGLRRYRDREGDTWTETAPGSGRYKLSHWGGEVPVEAVAESPARAIGYVGERYGPLTARGASPEPTAQPPRTLHQHAAVIALALANAAADGYALYDNGEYGEPVDSVLLCGKAADSHTVIDAPRAEGEA